MRAGVATSKRGISTSTRCGKSVSLAEISAKACSRTAVCNNNRPTSRFSRCSSVQACRDAAAVPEPEVGAEGAVPDLITIYAKSHPEVAGGGKAEPPSAPVHHQARRVNPMPAGRNHKNGSITKHAHSLEATSRNQDGPRWRDPNHARAGRCRRFADRSRVHELSAHRPSAIDELEPHLEGKNIPLPRSMLATRHSRALPSRRLAHYRAMKIKPISLVQTPAAIKPRQLGDCSGCRSSRRVNEHLPLAATSRRRWTASPRRVPVGSSPAGVSSQTRPAVALG